MKIGAIDAFVLRFSCDVIVQTYNHEQLSAYGRSCSEMQRVRRSTRVCRLWGLFTVALLCAAVSFDARSQDRDVVVIRQPRDQAEASIDINPINPSNLVVMGFSNPSEENFNASYSFDGGRSWRTVELGDSYPVCDQTGSKGDCITGFRSDPTVAFDANGRLYVGYSDLAGTLVVCRSLDGGRTYERCTIVDDTPPIDKSLLATGPDPNNINQQNVYIAQTGRIGALVELWRSTDGGRNFTASGTVGGTNQFGLFAQPSVGPNGELYVVWQTTGGSVRVSRSLNAGNMFEPYVQAAPSKTGFFRRITAQPDQGVYTGPTIDVDRSGGRFGGRVYIAYTDIGGGGSDDIDIFVRFSNDQGQTWSNPPTLVSDNMDDSSQFLPWLDVDQRTGLVSVAWYDTRDDATNRLAAVYSAFSSDGGMSFSDNMRVSDGQIASDLDPSGFKSCPPGFNCTDDGNFREYLGVAASDCLAYLVWADNSITLQLDYVSDLVASPSCPGGRHLQYLLGDKDGFKAIGPIDTPPQSHHVRELVKFIQNDPGQDTAVAMDTGGVNRPVGLTHFIRLPPQASLSSAKVTVRLKGDEFVKNDGIFFNATRIPTSPSVPLPLIAIRDVLGREPLQGEDFVLELDLSKVPVRDVDTTGGPGGKWLGPPDRVVSLLGVLNAEQRLDLTFSDDLTVDFSELRITYAMATDPSGDVDGDGAVNRGDLSILIDALNTDAHANDPRDLDGDGRITVLDARRMVVLCDNPKCIR